MSRAEGVRDSSRRCARGDVMYLLPDMNFGPEESIFVPFYGVPAATVPRCRASRGWAGQGGAVSRA
jgi:KDO2-lipid IV(A) lauroyltransferase